jgi:uncharacterized membrane protein
MEFERKWMENERKHMQNERTWMQNARKWLKKTNILCLLWYWFICIIWFVYKKLVAGNAHRI